MSYKILDSANPPSWDASKVYFFIQRDRANGSPSLTINGVTQTPINTTTTYASIENLYYDTNLSANDTISIAGQGYATYFNV